MQRAVPRENSFSPPAEPVALYVGGMASILYPEHNSRECRATYDNTDK